MLDPLPPARAAELEAELERLLGEPASPTAPLVGRIDDSWDAWAAVALTLVESDLSADPSRLETGRAVLRELRALAILRGEVLALDASRGTGPRRP